MEEEGGLSPDVKTEGVDEEKLQLRDQMMKMKCELDLISYQTQSQELIKKNLANEVEQLRAEIQEKDREIAELKDQLM